MNETKAEGLFDKAKGKIKEALGDTFGDQSLANSGAADQVKGNAKETLGNVKDAAHDVIHGNTTKTVGSHVENTGHDARESVTSTAEEVKNSIKRGLDHLEHKIND